MSNASTKADVTTERLKQLLSYEPETGLFRWLVDRHPGNGTRNGPGSIAGTIKSRTSSHPYSVIWVDGRLYRAKHLGYFDTKETAYAAYCVAAVDHFGQFARLDVRT
jgi:hypothetical protein